MTDGRAVVLRDYDQGPTVETVPVGPAPAGGLLVAVQAATVCGTDVHIVGGTYTHLATLPLVLGHEGCGEIVEVGAGVTSDAAGEPLTVGDRVVWAHNWCGRCYSCAVAKEPTLCESTMGYGWGPFAGPVSGTFAELVHVVADSRVLKVPDGVSSALASSATCALRTVMHAVDRVGRIRHSDSVVVLGAGPVGIYAAAVAHAAGAYRTILVGAPASRLAAAAGWGLAARLDIDTTTGDERVEAVRDLTDGRGADLVLECAGPAAAFGEGLAMLRRGGTMMVVGQAHGEQVPVDTTGLKVRQQRVDTSLSADVSHYHEALRFLERFAEPLGLEAALRSERYGLDEVPAALAAMRTGAEMKPVIDPTKTTRS